jgi:CheY-like chemotaxis protein
MDITMGDETPPSSPAAWKVLVVDDVQDLRDAIGDLLVGEGYEILEAGDGPTALKIIRGSRYPLVVLLDLIMPLMWGDAVIESLVREHILPGKHAIILMTASPTTISPTLRNTMAKCEIPVLRKTDSLEAIIAAVEQASARITRQQASPR